MYLAGGGQTLISNALYIAEFVNIEVLTQGLSLAMPGAMRGGQRAVACTEVVGGADFARLRDGWCNLQEQVTASVPFHTWDWARAAFEESAARGARPAVIVAGPLEAPQVIWPLVIERKYGIRVARWLGEPLAQYGDVLIAPEATVEDLEAAWRQVQMLPVDAVILCNVRETSAAHHWLQGRAQVIGNVECAPYMNFSRMRECGGFERTVGPRSARRQRSAHKRLAKLGTLDFKMHAGPDARATAEEAIALKRAWLSTRGLVGSPLEDDGWRARLIQMACAPGGLVSALHLDGRLIAAEIGFRHRDHYVAYLGAFAADVRSYSPGRVQMRLTMDWCAEQGVEIFDFLAPDDPYKREWTCASAEVRTYACGRTLAGRAGLRLLQWRPQLKTLYHALPPALRRIASRMISR